MGPDLSILGPVQIVQSVAQIVINLKGRSPNHPSFVREKYIYCSFCMLRTHAHLKSDITEKALSEEMDRGEGFSPFVFNG